jgi:hypothetical protein
MNNKQFLIIGNMNAITYKEVFPLIKANKMWLGESISSGDREFEIPEYVVNMEKFTGEYRNGKFFQRVMGVRWFTNIDHGKRHQPLQLMTMANNLVGSKHKEVKVTSGYQKYDNYDAIEVPFTDAIPSDYDGVMGVPISFLDKYCPEQFEIVGATESEGKGFSQGLWNENSGVSQPLVNNERVYKRILIRHRKGVYEREVGAKANKQFLIIGNMNAITYKEVFPLIKANKMWTGIRFNKRVNGENMTFQVPRNYLLSGTEVKLDENNNKFVSVAGTGWFTNIDHGRRHQPLQLMTMADNMKYSKHKEVKVTSGYQKYDNYDAIEVPFTDAIPSDYDGVMGVPISFLDKYCPEQFEIVNSNDYCTNKKIPYKEHGLIKDKDGTINGNATYARILIRHRKGV